MQESHPWYDSNSLANKSFIWTTADDGLITLRPIVNCWILVKPYSGVAAAKRQVGGFASRIGHLRLFLSQLLAFMRVKNWFHYKIWNSGILLVRYFKTPPMKSVYPLSHVHDLFFELHALLVTRNRSWLFQAELLNLHKHKWIWSVSADIADISWSLHLLLLVRKRKKSKSTLNGAQQEILREF